MQKITVAEIRGPLGKGEKKFYAVKDSKGAEFTTFDPTVTNLTPGTVINAEIVVDGKYNNLSKWEILEAAPASTSQNGGGYKKDIEGMDHEYILKARLQELERASIEAQVAYKGIIDLMVAGIDDVDEELSAAAKKWALAKLALPSPEEPKKEEKQGKGQPKSSDFLAWCLKEHKLSKDDVLKILHIEEKELHNLDLHWAHAQIIDYAKEHPKEGEA